MMIPPDPPDARRPPQMSGHESQSFDGPRLFRYVETGTLPLRNMLAVYDSSLNLLIIDRTLFGKLTPEDQRRTLCTQQSSLTVDLSNFTINNIRRS